MVPWVIPTCAVAPASMSARIGPTAPREATWQPRWVLSVGANVRNWFINPMNRPYLQVISTIDHSYWSYLHQLSYRLGAPLCRIAAGSLKKVRRIPIVQRREHGDFTNGIVMNLNLYKVGPHR